jgi:hypothetical protein
MKLLFLLIILLQVACGGGGENTGKPASFIIQPSSASGLEN